MIVGKIVSCDSCLLGVLVPVCMRWHQKVSIFVIGNTRPRILVIVHCYNW
jgi:hypothetical protein